MGRDTTEIERAVARTLRDSLEKLQRTTDEVNQAVGDLVSACSSAKPSNTLPHMLRAQTAAASLAATLDVLSRFITGALQPGWNPPYAPEEMSPEAQRRPSPASDVETTEAFAASAPPSAPPEFEAVPEGEPAPAAVEEALRTLVSETEAFEEAATAEAVPAEEPVARQDLEPVLERSVFDLLSLPPEQQELHRRANRVAKVSMQDIKMLRPGDVRAGKENNDLCARLRDDIERAHKEYERRFHAILDHPVDYFYAWMVEILGEGDPRALGEYPYPSPVVRR
jgi:hypothetical protein